MSVHFNLTTGQPAVVLSQVIGNCDSRRHGTHRVAERFRIGLDIFRIVVTDGTAEHWATNKAELPDSERVKFAGFYVAD